MTGKLTKFHVFLTLKDCEKYHRNVALPMLYINTKNVNIYTFTLIW